MRAQKLGVGYERRGRKTRLYHAKAIELYHEWENGDQELSFIEWLEANKWSRDYRNTNKEEDK